MAESGSHSLSTALLAWWGAVLATVLAVLRAIEFWSERRRRVIVKLKFAYAGTDLERVLIMEATNAGVRPVTLKQPFIRLPTRDSVFFPRPFMEDKPFPCELTEGASCSFMVQLKKIANAIQQQKLSGWIKVVAVFEDTLGKEHTSRPCKLDTRIVYREAGHTSVDE
ncbi:MAG: hypothetical protein IMF16_00965 [Proteobacteria bacterium]|nr:hypothetical protein [Pseudomonadota bacterium]